VPIQIPAIAIDAPFPICLSVRGDEPGLPQGCHRAANQDCQSGCHSGCHSGRGARANLDTIVRILELKSLGLQDFCSWAVGEFRQRLKGFVSVVSPGSTPRKGRPRKGGERNPQNDPLEDLVAKYRLDEMVFVTRPRMPELADYVNLLSGIWQRHWLTNNGPLHRQLEQRLASYLGVKHVSLFCNGTIALLVALQALRLQSCEVITTPFTFPATAHVLYWHGIRPVFCDVDEKTLNLDPNRIERLIGPRTRAIMPVHVYGIPCDVDAIQKIADRHGLHVIYDAAHAFGVKERGQPLASYGEISMLSFHATKLFTTVEGGALICNSSALHQRIEFLKNFGIADEETVVGPGINGKMNELQAAFGLLQLDGVEEEIQARRELIGIYRRGLADVPGVRVLKVSADTQWNGAYFPIFVDAPTFGMTRDNLYEILKKFNISGRRYFYPLVSAAPCYAALQSSAPAGLPVAECAASQVLCLPIYGALSREQAETIVQVVRECGLLKKA
jgi:dTDP-4-amino-4,6-dideoxygalactose transaminase